MENNGEIKADPQIAAGGDPLVQYNLDQTVKDELIRASSAGKYRDIFKILFKFYLFRFDI